MMRSFLLVFAAGLLAAVEPTPFIDLPTAAGFIGPENFQMDLEMSAWPVSDSFSTTLTAKASRVDGRFSISDLRIPSIERPSAQVHSLQWNANGIVAVVTIEGKTATVNLQVDSEQIPSWPSDRWSAEHPSVGPQQQGSVRAAIGSATMPQLKSPLGCRARLMRPSAPGRFDMGIWKDGLVGTFDLGTNPGPWNRSAMTRYTLPTVRDLRSFDGFRLEISAKGAPAVELGIWIQEATGSWWYCTRAVYATEKSSPSEVSFADFVQATAVGPLGPKDADGRLDLSQVQALGLGLIDSTGRGPITWTLKGWDLLPRRDSSKTVLVPAKVTVEPRFRSVNGQDQIPAGIFGGGDPALPPEWEPGSNRFVGGKVHIPRQSWTSLRPEDFPEAASIWKKLAETVKYDKQWSVFAELLNPIHVKNAQELAGDPVKAAKAMAEDLNITIRRSDLINWGELKSTQRTEFNAAHLSVIESIKAGQQPRPSDLMIANRISIKAMLRTKMSDLRGAGPTEKFYIESPFARTKLPAQLANPVTWKDDLATNLDAILATCALEQYEPVLEAWDAPGQGWMERIARRIQFYDSSKKTEGGPVTLLKTGQILEHVVWHQDPILGWTVQDPTQIFAWPGRADAVLHDAFALQMGTHIKAKNPKARFILGWGLPLSDDAWRVWEGLYRPSLDHCIGVLDGISEQHPTMDAVSLGGSYELLAAYGQSRHGKKISVYNTGVDDPRADRQMYAADARARERRMHSVLREMAYLLSHCPDKIASRIQLGCDATQDEMQIIYGYLLKRQRGRLVSTLSDDPGVWAVASYNERPERIQGLYANVKVLSVTLFNDHQQAQPVILDVAALPGTRLVSARRLWTRFDPSSGRVQAADEDLPAGGDKTSFQFTMEARSAVVVWAVLDGNAAKEIPKALEEQHFAPDLLREVQLGNPLTTTITLEPAVMKSAASARLRLVVEHLAPGEGQVEVAGQILSLPGARAAENENRTIELPLKLPLPQQVPLVFSVKDGPNAGYRVIAASVVIDSQR